MYCIKPAWFLNVRHLPSFEIDDWVFAGSIRRLIADADLVLFVIVINTKSLRYQMAVCNGKMKKNEMLIFFNRINSIGWVAQLVEQRTENPCVGGSIPPPATTL